MNMNTHTHTHTHIKMTVYDWIIEVGSFMALLYSFRPLLFFKSLGDTKIPIHYNIYGQVDGWGDREFLLLLPLLALVFYIGFSILSKHYKKFNYPVKVTAQNASSVYKLGARMMRHLKFFIILIFAYINNVSLSISMGNKNSLNGFVIIFLICSSLIIVFFFSIKIVKLRKSDI